jgi:hypothetical protein
MPQKLDWHLRNLFVPPRIETWRWEQVVERVLIYERAMARCPTSKSTTTVLGRRLTKEEISVRFRIYVQGCGHSHKDICKKNSALQSLYTFLRAGPVTEPLTVLYSSLERPLRVFYKFTGKRNLAKLCQAVSEELPFLIEIPWSDFNICLFGTDVWKLDSADETLELSDLKLLILDRIDRERQKFESLRRKFSGESGRKLDDLRQPIPESVRMYVWRRDEGKCVTCGSQERLEFDHIIPVCRGGSNTNRNIQLLCEKCNRSKMDRV